jgi:hypothetical protein
MQDETVLYMGRKVPKHGFRAFLFSKDGKRMIAESYEEFEARIQTGYWFDKAHEEQNPEIKEELKAMRKNKGK